MKHHVMDSFPHPSAPENAVRVMLACGTLGAAHVRFASKQFHDASQIEGWCPSCARYLQLDNRFDGGEIADPILVASLTKFLEGGLR